MLAICAMTLSVSAAPIAAQHETNNTSDDIFGRDIEFFGVSDTIEFRGRTDHNLRITGGPAAHTVHTFSVGDKFSFTTRMEFSASRFGDDDRDGRPLFVPKGELPLGPIGGSLVGLTPDSRQLRIRNHDLLFGGGAPGAIFDYASPWAIAVNDNVTPETATTTSTLGIDGGGAGFTVSITKALSSPTTVTVVTGFDDLFEFELTQPQDQGGINADAKQGFFAEGGTIVVTGFLKAIRPTNEDDFIWFDNYTAVTFDQIFEFQDPNPGLGTDEGIPGGVGDLLLRANVQTAPWDRYRIEAGEPASLLLLAGSLTALLLRRRIS